MKYVIYIVFSNEEIVLNIYVENKKNILCLIIETATYKWL